MVTNSEFVDPLLSRSNMDVFWSRRAVVDALRKELVHFHGTCLDIGCGRMPYKSLVLTHPSCVTQYIGMDLHPELRQPAYAHLPTSDLEWDGQAIPLDANSVDCAIATEIFQYFHNIEILMQETLRVLRPHGLFFFTVPFLWPLHDSPYDQFRYTPFALDRLLQRSGFHNIRLHALGGWDASLAQMLALWVRRRPMNSQIRRILPFVTLPIVRILQATDMPKAVFADQQMLTGISGTAQKPLC